MMRGLLKQYLVKKPAYLAVIKRMMIAPVCYWIPLSRIPDKIRFVRAHWKYLFGPGSKIAQCDVILACKDAHRTVVKEGRVYSILLDSLGDELEKLGLRVGRIALPFSSKAGKHAYGRPGSFNNAAFIYYLYADTGDMRRKYHLRKLIKKYEAVLVGSEAKALVVCTPSTHLMHAARRSNVCLYEMLHGLGYPNIDQLYQGREQGLIPDYVISMDRVTTQSLKRVLDPRKVVVSKPPWLSLSSEKDERATSLDIPEHLLDKARSYRRVVLVSLQWGYDGEKKHFEGIIENGILHKNVVEAIAKSKADILWLLRLHPVQSARPEYSRHREYAQRIAQSMPNVVVTGVSTCPISSLLSVCDAHVTMCSMVCYEAASLGVPSLLLCPTLECGGPLEDYFKDLVDCGIAEKVSVAHADIVTWISAQGYKRKRVNGPFYQKSELPQHIAATCVAGKETNTDQYEVRSS